MLRALLASALILNLGSGCAVSGQAGPGRNHSETGIFQNPNVWLPLLTATLLQLSDLDQQISDRLSDDTPLFGSTVNASESSDNFRDLTGLGYVTTAMLVPGPASTGDWISSKALLLGAESIVVGMNEMATTEIKVATDRERPNSRDANSFVSGHTSAASVQSQMAILNVEYLQMSSGYKEALNFTFNSLAVLTAWARVEAGEHYPSDVLAGWALGQLSSSVGRGVIDPGRLQVVVLPQTRPGVAGIDLIIKF